MKEGFSTVIDLQKLRLVLPVLTTFLTSCVPEAVLSEVASEGGAGPTESAASGEAGSGEAGSGEAGSGEAGSAGASTSSDGAGNASNSGSGSGSTGSGPSEGASSGGTASSTGGTESGVTGGVSSASGGATATDDRPITMVADFANDLSGLFPEVWDWAEADGGAEPLLSSVSWISDEGNPEPGTAMVVVPATAYDQQGMVQINFDPPLDLTGQELFVRYLRVSGFNPVLTYPGGVQFFVKTGSGWVWACAPWQNLVELGVWTEVRLLLEEDAVESAVDSVGSALPFTPSEVRAIGISFVTGAGPASGETAELPTPGVFYVDSIGYRPAS